MISLDETRKRASNIKESLSRTVEAIHKLRQDLAVKEAEYQQLLGASTFADSLLETSDAETARVAGIFRGLKRGMLEHDEVSCDDGDVKITAHECGKGCDAVIPMDNGSTK